MRNFIIICFFLLPVAVVLLLLNGALSQGDPGFKVDRTQKGLLISKIYSQVNPVRINDLIISSNGLSHYEVLGALILNPSPVTPAAFKVIRDEQVLEFPLKTVPHTGFSLFLRTWPKLTLIAVLLSLGAVAVYKRPPDHVIFLLCLMLCGSATCLAATFASGITPISPRMYSFAFLLHTPCNWFSFGLWLHFALRFPEQRDLIENRPWLPVLIYLVPAVTTIGGALLAAGFTPEFFGWVQRLRNIYLPVIIIAVFIKHATDYTKLKTQEERNRIKLPLIAYWLTFAPYLMLYLLPSLLLDAPVIPFHLAVFGFFILPVAYFIAILRYKLFNVDQIISKAIAYFVTAVTLTIIYSVLFAKLKKWFFGDSALSMEVFLVFLIFMNIIFHPMILGFDRLIRKLFFQKDNISIKVMHEFSRHITATIELSTIIKAVTEELPRAIQVTSTAVMTLNETCSRLFPETLRFGSSLWSQSCLITKLKDPNTSHINVFQVPGDPGLDRELKEIDQSGFILILPMRTSKALAGLLFVAPKIGGGLFSEQDILLLGSFANQAAIALENAIHHDSLVQSKQELEQMFHQKVQAEKMAAIGEMTSIMAHELKTPLSIIHSSAQYLVKEKRSESVAREMLEYIINEVDHLNNSITSILNMARQKPPEFSKIFLEREIRALIDQWVTCKDHGKNIDIRVTCSPAVTTIHVDFRQMAQVLLNLIRNSEEMMSDPGGIDIVIDQDNNDVLIKIIDNGPGVPRENLDQVFEKFFTTKEQGLGLGLAACRQIVQAHNGSITLVNRADGQSGAVASIRLPKQPFSRIGADQAALISLPE